MSSFEDEVYGAVKAFIDIRESRDSTDAICLIRRSDFKPDTITVAASILGVDPMSMMGLNREYREAIIGAVRETRNMEVLH